MEPKRRFLRSPVGSFFLFGPRGTGKSTWLRAAWQDAIWLDLLDPEAQRLYQARPERLRELVAGRPQAGAVVVDEVQKVAGPARCGPRTGGGGPGLTLRAYGVQRPQAAAGQLEPAGRATGGSPHAPLHGGGGGRRVQPATGAGNWHGALGLKCPRAGTDAARLCLTLFA